SERSLALPLASRKSRGFKCYPAFGFKGLGLDRECYCSRSRHGTGRISEGLRRTRMVSVKRLGSSGQAGRPEDPELTRLIEEEKQDTLRAIKVQRENPAITARIEEEK